MSDSTFSERPNLEQFKKQAKELLRDATARTPAALLRFHHHHPRARDFAQNKTRSVTLADAQLVIAREHGYESWPKFAKHIETLRIIRSVEELEDPLNIFLDLASVDRHGSHDSGTVEYADFVRERYLQNVPGNIFSAAVLGDAVAVRDWLARDPSLAIAKGGPHEWDALTYLCFSRYLRLDQTRSQSFVEAARALLEAGASAKTGWVEYIDNPPRPVSEPVIYGAAAIARNPELTKLLLDYGADPNDEETPYHVPESYDNTVLQLLLDSGRLNETSLATIAARKADWHDDKGLKLALEHGANPNYLTRWKRSPFHHSILRNNGLVMIEMSLDHGADPYLKNIDEERNAIQMAAYLGRGDILNTLEQRGFDLTLEGLDELVCACARANLDQAQSLTAHDPQLLTQLHSIGGRLLARFSCAANAAGVRCLLSLGIPATALWLEGDGYWDLAPHSTALHVAAWLGHHDVVRTLIAAGANVHALDARGRTPLQFAVRACIDSYWVYRRGPDSVAALLAAGASTAGISIPTGYDAIDELLMQHRSEENIHSSNSQRE